MPSNVTRHFVAVGTRQAHYRRAGSGPVVVLLHESPRSSAALLPQLRAFAERFTAIAIDTPGYGLSEPLPLDRPEIEDYADALAETLTALGIGRCAIFGNHTGALVAVAFAARHPQRTSGLVLEGMPQFTATERADLLANYAPEIEPRIDGGHLVQHWSMRRDTFTWFPWYRRTAVARTGIDLGRPGLVQAMHDGVMDALRATPSYTLSYHAAFRFDSEPALRAITCPVTVAAGLGDFMRPHLNRLPRDLPQLRALPLSGGTDEVHAALAVLLAEVATADPAPPAPAAATLPGRATKTYAATQYGQLLVRQRHDAPGRPVVLLHGSPTSAQALEPLIDALAAQRPVVAFDTLGNGDSDKPDPVRHPQFAHPSMRDYAPVVLEAIDALGIGEFDLYGTHTGAAIAAEVAILAPGRVGSVILDGVAMFDDATVADFLANYFLDLEPRWDGTHLHEPWTAYRDSTMWFPWYRRDREHALDFPVVPADKLQAAVLEFLKSGTTYPLSYRAAFEWDARNRLPQVRARTLVTTHPKDPLKVTTPEAAALIPGATGATSPSRLPEIAAFYGRFLDGLDVSAS